MISRLPLRRPWLWLVAGLLLAAALLQAGKSTTDIGGAERTAIPFPSLVYDIEATSNGHEASILNLGIGYASAPQVPMPVDVDGDLLPDVTVAVNLLDTQGIHNPPQPGDIIRPNIEINRFPLELGTTLLGRPSPPLRINVAIDVNDLEGEEDTMTARFGYDTGVGGSIPGFFQATVDGLEDFFNPVTATISTKGDLITQSSQPLWYRGPLTIIGGFEQGAFDADLGLEYSPFPDEVEVTYLRDDAGNHIDYAHAYDGEVDLQANAVIEDDGSRIDVAARIDRLPRQLGVDMVDTADGGAIHFDSTADGRLPDVDVRFRGPLLDDVFDAHLAIEALPSSMDASWSLPDDGPVNASFESSGQGIGAIEALITNKDGNPQGLPAFAFTERQVVAAHLKALADDTQSLRLGARIERITSASVSASPDGGIDADIQVGDGELPLELAGSIDLREADGPLVEAGSTLSPLPGNIHVSLVPAGEDGQTDPMTLRYESSESVDVDADVRVVDAGAPAIACGSTGVLCGDLRIRHIPGGVLSPDDRLGSIEARIGDFVRPDGKQESRIEVDSDGPTRPDFFADVSIGPGFVEGPAQNAGRPLVAHAEVLGLAKHLYVRTVEGQDDTLQRAEFHTCIRDYDLNGGDGDCVADPDDEADPRIGALEFSLANFLPEDRDDADVQVPSAYAATPNFATITARGHDEGSSVAFEATGRMQDIREVLYVNQGAFGVRTDIGGNQPLATVIDVEDIAFGEPDGPAADPELFDVSGDVLIDPLPRLMTVCFNSSGQAIPATPAADITEPCEDANPFDPDGADLDESPLSFSYDGEMRPGEPQEFDVDADAEIVYHGDDGDITAVDDNRTIRGHLEIDNVPARIRAHVLDPDDQGGGPLRVLVDAPTLADQLTVFASAALLDGDLQCEDPRVPKRLDPDTTQAAVCAQGRIDNVPERLTLDYDAAVPVDNFVLDSSGEKQLDLVDLKVSSVTRDEPEGGGPARAQVLIAEGEILDLPRKVSGTLQTPAPDRPEDPVLIDLRAPNGTENLIGAINARVRNFVAPDPVEGMPAQRVGLTDPKALGPDGQPIGDWASFIQRGDAFEGELHISKIKRVGFKNQVDGAGNRLDTNVINVDFGQDKTIRGYVDIDKDGTDRVIGDVTLEQIPAGLQVCFRSPTTKTAAPAPSTGTFCDSTPAAAADRAKVGAFEARMASDAGAELDVDAFVRSAQGGGSDILAARVDIDNIPNVIAGTFGDGKVDVGGYRLDGTPDGIDRIYGHAASFDLPDDGWTAATRPYEPRFVNRAPFPTPFPSTQHVAVRADDSDFELRARIGEVEPSNVAASNLHRIQMSDTPCSKPTGVDYGNGAPDYGPRPDFPHLPTTDGSKHTCIRGDFEPVGPNQVDPLALSLVVDKGGKRLSVDRAQLDDIPEFFQVNVADAVPLQDQDDQRMRPHCIGVGRTQPANCVAPLVRLDTPGNSRLSGVVQYGLLTDLDRLRQVAPREALPDDLTDAGDLAFAGDDIRARVGSFGETTAASAAFRIPIPASFTIDQVQSWSMQNLSNKANYLDASDLHFRYAARNDDGASIGVLLKLSAMIHSFTDGTQILLSDDDPSLGVQIPGDLGVEVYARNHNGKGRNFIQIDGRSSAPDLDLRARLLGTGGSPIGRLDAQVRDVPDIASTAYPAADAPLSEYGTPSFRIRAETLGEGKEPPDPSGADPASAGAPPKEKECSPLLCVLVQVRLKSVNVQFDFQPDGAPSPVRLLEAVIRTDGAKNGVEIRGFDDIDNDANDDGTPDATAAPFLAGAQLEVDPLNMFVHAGIPLLASLDFVLISDLDAAVSIGGAFDNATLWSEGTYDPGGLVPELVGPGTDHFSLKQNLVKMTVSNSGPDGSFSQIGPIDFNVDIMHGEAWALFVKLIGIDWVPPGLGLRLPFLECQALGLVGSSVVQVPVPALDGDGDSSRSVVAWPFFSPPAGRVVYSGLLGGPLTLVGNLAGPFFCLIDTDQTLIDDGPKPHPADPLGVGITGSGVPDARVDASELVQAAPDDGPVVLPNLTVTASTPALCGTKTYQDITVPNGVTLNVATSANSTKIDGVDACPAGSENTLELIAAGNVIVGGTIQASGLISSTNASGNGGGGHGREALFIFPEEGRGGAGGTTGAGGAPTGDFGDPFEIEPGNAGSSTSTPAGAGGAAGNGGGVIKVIADTLTVSGAIRADGLPGTAKGTAPAECFDPDTDGEPDTDDPPNDTGKPNTGFAGGGGGSGGGIVIHAAEYVVTGSISANGGAGGAGTRGGGGGGGGGNIKVSTALVSGNAPTAAGGAGGDDTCGDTADDPGNPGGAGDGWSPPIAPSPKSKVDISAEQGFGFWNSTADTKSLVLPYKAAAEISADVDGPYNDTATTSDDFEVVLCASTRTTATNLPSDKPLSQVLMPSSPDGIGVDDPCGGFTVGELAANPGLQQPQQLAVAAHDLRRTTGATFTLPSLSEAYYGFYTVLFKSADSGNSCFDHDDQTPGNFLDFFSEQAFDEAVCTPIEEEPTSPDLALGIDNSAPNIQSFSVHNVAVRDGAGAPIAGAQPVPANTSAIRLVWNDTDNVGVVGRDCSGAHGSVGYRSCVSGQTVNLVGGDGTKTVGVRLVDAAGNEDTFTADVLLDRAVPASSGEIVAGSASVNSNGWYDASPDFRLFGLDDGTGTGAGDPAYEFQFDDATTRPCAPVDCTISTDLPGRGRHQLRWTGIDKVGNRFTADDDPNTPAVDGRQTIQVKIDGDEPISELLSVPAAPNGANGWYSGTTWVTFGAFDQPGASGFTQAPDDAPQGQIGGVSWTKSHNGGPAVAQPLFNPQAPAPVRLDPGRTDICWFAKDQAGNAETQRCRTFFVDEDDPTTSLPSTPAGPDGAPGSGWYDTSPTVNPTVTDTLPNGSGVGGDLGADVCTQKPLIAPVAPSGTCISVDGSPFFPVLHAATPTEYLSTLGEGLHEVRAFATDAAGRRSGIVTRLFKVDLSAPVAVARTVMPQASAGKWWRHQPVVVLRAADGDQHGSGVQEIRYQLSGTTAVPPCTASSCVYTKPFTVPPGVHQITYWATDEAGRAQAPQTLKLAVDTTPPVPKATTPNPALWLRSRLGLPLTSPTVDLRFTLQENLSGIDHADNNGSLKDQVRVKVTVYDVMGYPVRTLDAGLYTVKPNQTVNGLVKWDGKGRNLTSLVPVGTYYYRVTATDAAGNVAMSGESTRLLIALKLL